MHLHRPGYKSSHSSVSFVDRNALKYKKKSHSFKRDIKAVDTTTSQIKCSWCGKHIQPKDKCQTGSKGLYVTNVQSKATRLNVAHLR